jgi:STE24 endopeptidase
MRRNLQWLGMGIILALAGGGWARGEEGPPVLRVPEGARATAEFDVERATEAYLALIPPDERARSDAYFEGGYWIPLLSWLWGAGVALLLLGRGRFRRLRDGIAERFGEGFRGDVLTVGAFFLFVALLSLPLTLWTGYFREHAYGLSNHTLGSWFADWGKGLGVSLVLFAPAVVGIYGVVRSRPRSWWVWGTGLATLFLIFGIVIGPVFIAPLFNRYERLEEGELRDRILSMARAQRVPADNVWWFDASRQTQRISANVSGFAGTMRISLNDNLLRRSSPEAVLAVLGHEIGHYVLNHVAELVLQLTLVLLAGFAFVHFGFERVRRRFGESWRLEGVGDLAGLPLAYLLLATFFLLATPVTNSIIRVNEAEADAFGLAVSREPDGFAHVAVQLAEYRKMRPGRFEEILFYDHPSGYDRIRRAMEWKREHLAEFAAREAALVSAAE